LSGAAPFCGEGGGIIKINDNAVGSAHFEMPATVQNMIDTGFNPVTAFRTAKGMSIGQLAEASGVEAIRIENFEAGQGNLRWPDFKLLGKALAVPPKLLPND
jgi:hypothetical protein